MNTLQTIVVVTLTAIVLILARISVFIRLSNDKQGMHVEVYLFTLVRIYDCIISTQLDGLKLSKGNKVIPYSAMVDMKNTKHFHLIRALKFYNLCLIRQIALSSPKNAFSAAVVNTICSVISHTGLELKIYTQYTLFDNNWECSGNVSTSIYAIIKQIIIRGSKNARKSANTTNS